MATHQDFLKRRTFTEGYALTDAMRPLGSIATCCGSGGAVRGAPASVIANAAAILLNACRAD